MKSEKQIVMKDDDFTNIQDKKYAFGYLHHFRVFGPTI